MAIILKQCSGRPSSKARIQPFFCTRVRHPIRICVCGSAMTMFCVHIHRFAGKALYDNGALCFRNSYKFLSFVSGFEQTSINF